LFQINSVHTLTSRFLEINFNLLTCNGHHKQTKKKANSMVWVRERTIPTERPPLVGEVIANFCG
jgi:hypothetical protein